MILQIFQYTLVATLSTEKKKGFQERNHNI